MMMLRSSSPAVTPSLRHLCDNISCVPHLRVTGGLMLDPRKRAFTVLMVLLLLPSAAVTQSQSPTRSSTKHATEKPEDFAAVMQKMRDTWVQEFNTGHADTVAALYAQEGVLMRRNGSVHNRDSIPAALE